MDRVERHRRPVLLQRILRRRRRYPRNVPCVPTGRDDLKSPAMSDDTSKKGIQDRTRINTSEDYELRYWSEKFDVSREQLKAAVNKVGNSVSAVQKELKAA